MKIYLSLSEMTKPINSNDKKNHHTAKESPTAEGYGSNNAVLKTTHSPPVVVNQREGRLSVISAESVHSHPSNLKQTEQRNSTHSSNSISVKEETSFIKAWKGIFVDDKDYGQIDDSIMQAVSKGVHVGDSISGLSGASDLWIPKSGTQETDVSIYSIIPGGISINTDLKNVPSKQKRKPGNRLKRRHILPCGSKYTIAKEKLFSATHRVENYYDHIVKDLEDLEAEFAFDIPSSFSEELNIIGAQIWFATFAMSRQISEQNMVSADIAKWQTLYKNLVKESKWLQKMIGTLETITSTFSESGLEAIRSMKKISTGSPETDLAADRMDSEIWKGPEKSPVTDLVVRAMMHHKVWENRFASRLKGVTPSMDYMISGPDNLKSRRSVDIFMRNVTKAGWVNFQVHFDPKGRIDLIEEVVQQVIHGISNIRKILPRIVKKFKSGFGGCTFSPSCIPWLKKMNTCVKVITAHNSYNQMDREIVRLQIFCAETYLKNIIIRGSLIQSQVQNIAETVAICCQFLESSHFFRVPGSENLAELGKEGSKNLSKPYDDCKFFLNDYLLALKQVPIRYGMVEYILIHRISTSRQHSGANFNGPLFIKIR